MGKWIVEMGRLLPIGTRTVPRPYRAVDAESEAQAIDAAEKASPGDVAIKAARIRECRHGEKGEYAVWDATGLGLLITDLAGKWCLPSEVSRRNLVDAKGVGRWTREGS